MNHLLAGVQAGGMRDPRAWQPPTVAELQQLLPQYEITAFIARGGMGAVYKGVQRALNRTVAIKILPLDCGVEGEANFPQRFKHEAQAMARLSHPAIVTVFEAGETEEGLLYFVMEHIEGTDLARLIKTEGRLEAARVIPIITAVCEALAFAHEEGIVHRDIKPSNVMIDKRGRVKVADFGLAKTVSLESPALTSTALALGTVDFIAPEAMIPGMEVDQRADIYAVGVMLYQLLTGHLPRGRFELPSTLSPRIDARFDEIVHRALQTDREKRYSTVMEMKMAVEGTAPVPSQDTRPLALAPAAKKGVSRWLLPAAIITLLVAGGWGFQPFTGTGTVTTAAPVPAARKPPATHPTGVWIPVTFPSIDPRAGNIQLQPDGSVKVHHGFALPGFVGKNIALKARVRRAAHVRFSGVHVRAEGPKRVALQLGRTAAWLDTASPPTPPPTAIPLQPQEGVDTPVALQLILVGDHAYGRVGGRPLPPLKVDLLEAGTIGIWSGDGEFSHIEVMLLDGLPEAEALKLAGMEAE
ncbi:MAG: serine/threonine-protein kinase [Prosthecobacter sp.]